MIHKFTPLLSYLLSSRPAIPVEECTVCAEDYIEIEPAISLENEFDRVISFQEETNEEIERERIFSPIIRNRPTKKINFGESLLYNGRLYHKNGRMNINSRSRDFLVRGELECVETAALTVNSVSERYFGHWIRDCLSTEILAKEMGLMCYRPFDISGPTSHGIDQH
jgi:hypothetical protein